MRCGGITETKWNLLNVCVLASNHKMRNLTITCLAEANSPSCFLANSEILVFVFVQTSVFLCLVLLLSFPFLFQWKEKKNEELGIWVDMISCVSPGSVPTCPFLPLLMVLLHHRVCVPFCYNSPLKRDSFLIQLLMKSDILEWDSSLTWCGSTLLHAKSEVLNWTVIWSWFT